MSRANTVDNMAFSPAELVAFHSRMRTLEPGDLISTSTPDAHVLEPEITIRAEVDTVGRVRAEVVSPPERGQAPTDLGTPSGPTVLQTVLRKRS